MSIQDSIFEAMCEFAVTVGRLANAGWTFRLESGDRYSSPVLHLQKGKREERCYSEGDVEKLLPIAEGVFDETWDAMTGRDAYRAYDEGFEHCQQGWSRNDNSSTWGLSSEEREGYLKGWNDAKDLGLHYKDRK